MPDVIGYSKNGDTSQTYAVQQMGHTLSFTDNTGKFPQFCLSFHFSSIFLALVVAK
jgi:hypothetical protein